MRYRKRAASYLLHTTTSGSSSTTNCFLLLMGRCSLFMLQTATTGSSTLVHNRKNVIHVAALAQFCHCPAASAARMAVSAATAGVVDILFTALSIVTFCLSSSCFAQSKPCGIDCGCSGCKNHGAETHDIRKMKNRFSILTSPFVFVAAGDTHHPLNIVVAKATQKYPQVTVMVSAFCSVNRFDFEWFDALL
jgi:hypothetical protein